MLPSSSDRNVGYTALMCEKAAILEATTVRTHRSQVTVPMDNATTVPTLVFSFLSDLYIVNSRLIPSDGLGIARAQSKRPTEEYEPDNYEITEHNSSFWKRTGNKSGLQFNLHFSSLTNISFRNL
jgi:hypothetical protein